MLGRLSIYGAETYWAMGDAWDVTMRSGQDDVEVASVYVVAA